MTADIASLEGLGGRFQLLRLQATERLGELPEFDLELFSPSVGEDLRACLGEFVCVSVPKCDGELRYFNGIIIQISRIGAYARGEKIRAKISTRLWLATRNRECRIFEGMSVPDIVTEILTARQLIVAAERLDSARYQPWDYLVQYRESDFDFISRILAHEGIYYYFRYLETSHELVLADSMASHDAIAQYDVLPIIPASNRTHNRDRITGISQQFSSRGAKSTLQAHDFRLRYGTDLVVHGLTEPGASLPHEDGIEYYDYAEHYTVIENAVELGDSAHQVSATGLRREGERYARAQVEQENSDRVLVDGEGDLRGLQIGALFAFDDSAAPQGQHLVVSTHHDIRGAQAHSTGGGATSQVCLMKFTATSRQFRPAAATETPSARGPETAIVVGPESTELATDKFGRVRVRFFWERHDRDSCWLRVAQNSAGPSWGSFFLPRVGHEVLVHFLGGDINRPIVAGSLYNSDSMPPYALPEHASVSTIKTRSTPEGSRQQYHELRFQDRKGHEQLFMHAQGRMDLQVRASSYESVGGNREQTIGHEDKGDFNRTVANDINEHAKGGRYELVEKKLNSNVKLEVVEVFENNHTVAVTERQTLNARELVLEAGETLSLKGGTVVMQGAQSLSLKAGNIKLEGTQCVSLKCGGNFLVLTPSGVFINGSMVFVNSGGASMSADAPLAMQDPTIETPLDALPATSAIPGSSSSGIGGGGGSGGGSRSRTSRTVPLNRAPEPPPPPPLHPTIVPGSSADRAFLSIAWSQAQTYCGGPVSLQGTTREYADGSSETAEIRNVTDGATVLGVNLAINGNAFDQPVDVKDWLPRRVGADFELSRDEDAFAAGQKTPTPLTMKFVPNAPLTQCAISSPTGVGSHFGMEVHNFECHVQGSIQYVKGYMAWIIQLGAHVPAGTGGDIGLNWGAANPNAFSGNDWRFCKGSLTNLRYWDGTAWQPVPATWSDTNSVKLYGIGIWNEGGANRAQFGGTWPEAIPAWSAADTARAASTLPTWSSNSASAWSNKFDLRRQGCSSSDQHCCRYSVQASVSFVEVAARSGHVIVLGANDSRSNADAWGMGDTRPALAPHEFGHHLGNPDEYAGGVGIDTTVNTDGATAGIDPSCLMGSVPAASIPPIKARHLNIIKQHLSAMIQTQEGVAWTFDTVPHI